MQSLLGESQFRQEGTDLGFTDTLTGLGNHRRFFDKIERLIDERADDPAPFAIGILDLDGFKPINDLFGHKAGDDILVQVAMRLRAAMDSHSIVTRVRADEFAFLFPMVFSEDVIAERARMMIEILSAPYDVGDRTARLSASVGCALFYSGDETAANLTQKAETALYHAKRSGRGRVVVYTREMEEAAKRVTRIEQALRRAVSAGEVEPFFQPIVDLQTRRTIGFETLARWSDRDLGFVSPSVSSRSPRNAASSGRCRSSSCARRSMRRATGLTTCSFRSTCRPRSSSTRTPVCTSCRSSTRAASIRAGWRSRSRKPA